MSTKIYNAWRVRPSKIKSFLEAIRKHMFAQVIERAQLLMKAVEEGAFENFVKKDYEKYGERSDLTYDQFKEKHGESLKLRMVFKEARKASKSLERSPFDLECGVNLYPNGSWIYTIPFGEYYTYQEFDPDFEEYGYWNNTDPPDGTSNRQWQARAKNWEPIIDDIDAYRMVHWVVRFQVDYANSSIGVGSVAEEIVGPDEAFIATFMGFKECLLETN